jgi:hypothetical protein
MRRRREASRKAQGVRRKRGCIALESSLSYLVLPVVRRATASFRHKTASQIEIAGHS